MKILPDFSKPVVVACMAIALAGCGKIDRWWAGMTGDASEVCIDGVAYLQFTSGATVKYRADGRVATCGK